MAVESITVGDLVGWVSFELTNKNTPATALGTQIKVALHETMMGMLSKSDFSEFKTEATVSLVAGTQDYDLPDDFWKIVEPGVYLDDANKTVLKWYEEQDRVEQGWVKRLESDARPCFYTIRGRQGPTADAASRGRRVLRMVPTPDTTYTLRYTYLALPTPIRTAGDSVELDERFPRAQVGALWRGACLLFPNYLNANQIALFQQAYGEGIQDMLRKTTPVIGAVQHQKSFRGGRRQGYGTLPDRISQSPDL